MISTPDWVFIMIWILIAVGITTVFYMAVHWFWSLYTMDKEVFK